MNTLEAFSFSDYRSISHLAHGVKDGDRSTIIRAASYMANIVSVIADRHCVIIPMPGRTGVATYTKQIAEQISCLTGIPIADTLRSRPHMPQYLRKKLYGNGSLALMKFFSTSNLPADTTPILIDNVLDTGTTAMSALAALGCPAKMVVLGNTNNFHRYHYPISLYEPSSALYC